MSEIQINLANSIQESEFLYKTRRHPEVDKMLSGNPPSSMAQHTLYLDLVQDKTRWIYIASTFREDSKIFVGYSQIYDLTEETIEIGFVIHPDEQGRGYGKDLVLKTIAKAKEKFPNKKVILYVLRNNHKAKHIYEKLGFIEKTLPSTDEVTLGMELTR